MKYLLYALLFFVPLNVGATDMQKAKSDAEKLMNAVLPLAEQMLSEYGGFYPYGGAINAKGEIESVAAYNGDEQPPSAELILLLQKRFRSSAEKGEYIATALVYDVRVKLPNTGEISDAISIAIDHKDNYSIVILQPYSIENNELYFGDMFAQQGKNDIF